MTSACSLDVWDDMCMGESVSTTLMHPEPDSPTDAFEQFPFFSPQVAHHATVLDDCSYDQES